MEYKAKLSNGTLLIREHNAPHAFYLWEFTALLMEERKKNHEMSSLRVEC